jgi:glycosyltransferase 2 family protein
MSATSRPVPRLLFLAAKISVSAGLLFYLLAHTDVTALLLRLRQMDLRWMAAGLAFYSLMIGVSVWRWHILLNAQGMRVPAATLSGSFLVATFFNNFLPSNIGGDVVRVADTASYAGSKTVAATVILADRGIGMVALLLLAACGSAIAASAGIPVPGAGYLWLVLFAAVGGAAPFVVTPNIVPRALQPLRVLRPEWVDERLALLGDSLARFRRCPGTLAAAFVGAVVVQLILVAFHFCAARSLSVPLPVTLALVVVPIGMAAQMLPISINGLGVREAVFSYFFVRLGLGIESALALSLASAGLIMLFSVSGGVVFLLRQTLMPRAFRSDRAGWRDTREEQATPGS